MRRTRYWKTSFLATKSVSQLSSTTAALFSSCATASKPSAAVRDDFFAARTTPLFLRSFCASSESDHRTGIRAEDITRFLNRSDEKEELTDVPVAGDQRSLDVFDRSAGPLAELLDEAHLLRSGHLGAETPVKRAVLQGMVASLERRGRSVPLSGMLLGTRQEV
jgi:hypothetical protein